MAALGGLTGTLFALSFKTGINPLLAVVLAIFISGLVGTARLLLNKHKLWQLIAGYFLGFLILYLVIYLA
jgi:ABC-type uncharacterized transport system permease subunit